ncbi:MAG: GNAT family N-acetyltransferase [Pseudomonadota bacterium]
MSDAGFRFRPVIRRDGALLRRWLADARVARWFDEPDYARVILEEHLKDPRLRVWMVEQDGQPLAYLQDYDIHGFKDHPLAFLPQGARGVDTFIGTSAQMGQGRGPAYLRAFCARCFAQGCPAMGIDPHPDNRAAIRAYEKAGFRPGEVCETEWGPALLMNCWPTPEA